MHGHTILKKYIQRKFLKYIFKQETLIIKRLQYNLRVKRLGDCLLVGRDIYHMEVRYRNIRVSLGIYVYQQCNYVPVAARSKAQVCDRSPAEIAGSNSKGGRDVCLL